MTSLKKAKMADLVNYRLRIVTVDGRQLSGQMLAFDKHMNVVLVDTEEFRATKKSIQQASLTNDPSKIHEEKRTLGLVIIRGETIVSVTVEAPPPSDPSTRLGGLQPGPGIAKSIGRGTTPSLSGPMSTRPPPPSGFGQPQLSGFGQPGGFGAPPPGFRPKK